MTTVVFVSYAQVGYEFPTLQRVVATRLVTGVLLSRLQFEIWMCIVTVTLDKIFK